MKTLSEDLIKRFLKESTINNSAFIDDAPPTFYKSFSEYRDKSKQWLDGLYSELGWQVVDYMISDGAEDPGFDYKLRYRALGSPTFGDAGTKRGAKESVTLWKKRKQKELSQLGWEVVAWLGEKEAYKSVIGTILAPGANQKREVSENKVQMFSKEWWLESLKTEDDVVKNKKTGSTYVVKKHNPKTQDIVKKDTKSKIVKTKPYSDEQAEEEVGEYFENDFAFKSMPGLAKDENDLKQKILDAPEETLSDNDLKNMMNTDAADVAKSDNPIKYAKQKAIEYDKSWDYITKNIKSGAAQEAPIAVRDKNGNMWLLAGNTRLMAQTAFGNKIPVKVINYDKEIKEPKTEIKEDLLIEGMTLEEGVKFDNFLKDLANRGKQPLEKIRKSMMNKNTLSVAKLNNFSVDKLFQNGRKGFQAYQKIINYVPDKLAKNLAKTKLGQKKEKGLKKLDNFLQEHPKLKRVMGMGAAAAVTYAWTKMTFIGDPEYDLDLSSAATAAATGDVSFSDLFAGEMGTKFLVLTAVGATTGLTAPYVKAFGSVGTMAAGLSFGAFRAYKKRKESKVDKQKTKTKSPDVVKNPNPRGRKKMISTQSAVRWVAKNKGNKAALKYAKSLSEVSKTGTPKGSEEIGGYKGFVDEKDYESYKKWISKSLRVQLLEGGAAGHMNHPFDDADLTFGDLKKIIKLGLSGKLNREDNVTEKLDGQNLLISWKGNQLVAARNKGQLKGFGENALNINAVKSLFAGRGVIKDTFVFAMKDLSKAITKLSDKQKEKVFGNGKRWMNLEVMYPASANVVNYDGAYLVFHNATEYTEAGVAKKIDASLARILEGMIRQVNQHVQKKFTISKPNFLKVAKTQDFAKRQKYFLSKLQKLQNIYRLKDNDTLGKYHETYWMEFIYNASKQYKYRIPRTVLLKLTKRWAFLDKSFRLDKKNIKNEKFLDWAKSTDKKDLKKLQKDNIKPFEILFFELGAEILKNVSGFLAANPKATVAKMKKEVDAAVKQLKSAKDVSKLDTLKRQLEKFQAIGGSDAIVPSEGIVFKYKNKIYKFTGAFAPINQILGLLKFG